MSFLYPIICLITNTFWKILQEPLSLIFYRIWEEKFVLSKGYSTVHEILLPVKQKQNIFFQMLLWVVTQKHFATEIIFSQGWFWGFTLPASQLLIWKPQERVRHSLGIYSIPQNLIQSSHAMNTWMTFEQKLRQCVFSGFCFLGFFVYSFTTTISLEGDFPQERLHRMQMSLLCSYQRHNYERGIKLTLFRGQSLRGAALE